MKPPLRIENKNKLNVISNQSQMDVIEAINLFQENLARDLHDDISQYITTMSLYITKIITSNDLDIVHDSASEMKIINSEMIFSLKTLVGNLRRKRFLNCSPQIVTKEDYLILLKGWEKLNSSILLKYRVEIPREIDSEILSHCYKILKESLANISRHAQAKNVSVHIKKNMDSFQIKVSDDGIGFKTNNHDQYTFGLIGMKERAKQIGAFITLTSAPNHGTHIYVLVPLNQPLYE